jgi:hypothetical protein
MFPGCGSDHLDAWIEQTRSLYKDIRKHPNSSAKSGVSQSRKVPPARPWGAVHWSLCTVTGGTSVNRIDPTRAPVAPALIGLFLPHAAGEPWRAIWGSSHIQTKTIVKEQSGDRRAPKSLILGMNES